jgi:hypothetical protein
VTNLISNIVGAIAAIIFVGYFAYKVNELPLTIIVIVGLALMVYALYEDMLDDRILARFRARNAGSDNANG